MAISSSGPLAPSPSLWEQLIAKASSYLCPAVDDIIFIDELDLSVEVNVAILEALETLPDIQNQKVMELSELESILPPAIYAEVTAALERRGGLEPPFTFD